LTAFSAFANATLTFKRQVGSVTIDALGNRSVSTQDFVITAYLKEVSSNRQQEKDFDGGLDNVIAVEGRCVEPATLPPDIVPGMMASAVIGGKVGEFYLEPALPSAFGTVEATLGDKLKGRFVVRIVMGEAT